MREISVRIEGSYGVLGPGFVLTGQIRGLQAQPLLAKLALDIVCVAKNMPKVVVSLQAWGEWSRKGVKTTVSASVKVSKEQ
jgi:hypothetical protein